MKQFFNVFGKLFGIALIVSGTLFLTIFLGSLSFSSSPFVSNGIPSEFHHIHLGSSNNIIQTGTAFFQLAQLKASPSIYDMSMEDYYLFLISSCLFILLPVIASIYLGIKLLFRINFNYRIGMILFVLWIISIIISVTYSIGLAKQVAYREKISNKIHLPNTMKKIHISARKWNGLDNHQLNNRSPFDLSFDKDSIYTNRVRLRIFQQIDTNIVLKNIKYSRGNSRKDARKYAEKINHLYFTRGDSIIVDKKISFPNDGYRNQRVKLELYLPVGKVIHLDKSLKNVIYDIDNVTNTWDPHMLGKDWVMLEEGLTCLDCSKIKGVSTAQLDSIKASTN